MSSPLLPTTAIPMPLAEDDDDVSWALQTAAVQWGRGAHQDALVWLRRAAESAIELNAWSRGADLNAAATRLEKLVAQAQTGSSPSSIPVGAPSIRPGQSARPSFPVPGGSQAPSAWRRSPSSSVPRNSLVSVDVEESELDMSDEELRRLEAESAGEQVPTGYRPSTHVGSVASQRPSFPHPVAEQLPSYSLEPSAPLHDAQRSSPSGLPAFPLEPSSQPPAAFARVSRAPRAESQGLPSFPIEATGASSLPPVSQWPAQRSNVPGLPGLPRFSAAPPSRSFANDGDDGAPGLDDSLTRQLDTGGVNPSVPPISYAEPVFDDEIEDIEEIEDAEGLGVVELAPSLPPVPEPKPKPTSVPRLPIRPGAASTRPKVTSALPPATKGATSSGSHASEPRMPLRLPIEPRMPSRIPSSSPINARASSPSNAKPSGEQRLADSIPPSSKPRSERPRSIEPHDLPTVTSPSVRPEPVASVRPEPVASVRPEPVASVRPEPVASVRPEPVASVRPEPVASVRPEPTPVAAEAIEEPLAILPKVASNPSVQPGEVSPSLMGVCLADVRGFSELPALALDQLAKVATIEHLNQGEEASDFSVALVLDGWVSLMPAISDAACATAVVGEVVFTEGTLDNGLSLRVVAGQDAVVVATWDSAAILDATKDCPWLADDLKLLADGFQALAGACLGPLGDRLDESLRSLVTSRCEIRTLLPGEQLCAANKPVPGMHIIGGGEIELVDENNRVNKTHGTGEFLFAAQVLAGGGVPFTARAGRQGALVLFAPRMAAHELMVSVPPLLEILAD